MSKEAAKNENIVLIGFMGCGKSSVGRLIAEKLRYRFVDTDQSIVRETGVPISEIFATHGEDHFRDLETEVLESLRDKRGLVIATGGGIVTRVRNLPLLRELGFVAWLNADEDVIFERVSRNKRRPLLQTENPRETIHKLLVERLPMYQGAAQITIDTGAGSHDEIADAVIRAARASAA